MNVEPVLSSREQRDFESSSPFFPSVSIPLATLARFKWRSMPQSAMTKRLYGRSAGLRSSASSPEARPDHRTSRKRTTAPSAGVGFGVGREDRRASIRLFDAITRVRRHHERSLLPLLQSTLLTFVRKSRSEPSGKSSRAPFSRSPVSTRPFDVCRLFSPFVEAVAPVSACTVVGGRQEVSHAPLQHCPPKPTFALFLYLGLLPLLPLSFRHPSSDPPHRACIQRNHISRRSSRQSSTAIDQRRDARLFRHPPRFVRGCDHPSRPGPRPWCPTSATRLRRRRHIMAMWPLRSLEHLPDLRRLHRSDTEPVRHRHRHHASEWTDGRRPWTSRLPLQRAVR